MEKDIEILEKLIEKYDEPCGMHINPTELWQDERDAIENLINRVKELEEDNKHQWEERCKMAIELDNDVIPISKIKEKIEELEKEQEQNRKELSRGIDYLSDKMIDAASNKIEINMSIREYLEYLLKQV